MMQKVCVHETTTTRQHKWIQGNISHGHKKIWERPGLMGSATGVAEVYGSTLAGGGGVWVGQGGV